MSNPHFNESAKHRPPLIHEDVAHGYLEAEGVGHETMSFSALNRIAEATLALAYEQRTANLLEYAIQVDDKHLAPYTEVETRLGLGGTE